MSTESNNEEERNQEHNERMKKVKEAHDAEVRSKNVRKGVLIVNTGDGKGKSSSAFGVAIRAAGHGMKVAVVQFTKGKWKTGEGKAFTRFDEIDHFIVGDGFTWNTQDRAQDIASARSGWEVAMRCIDESRGDDPKYQVVILDELNIITGYEYLPSQEVVDFLKTKPHDLHVVVTGRGASDELIEIADTVTRMEVVKHAYASGIKAAKGIEF